MKEFFTNLLSGVQNSHKRRQPARRDRHVRLSVEALEGRELPSASPMTMPLHSFSPNALSQVAHSSALLVHLPVVNGPNPGPGHVLVNNGPDLSGDSFIAVVPPGVTAPSYGFQIQKMTGVAGSARQYTFTGTWDGNP